MPEHKILVLGEHSNGLLGGDKADARHHERGMNIACGVVIAVVIIAMIVATVVYFCVNKQDGGSVSVPGESAKDPLYVADVPAPKSELAKKQESLMAGPKPSASAFGQVPVHQAPRVEGPLFPRLSAEDERELAKTHQLAAVKNYAQGQKNAILSDMKYNMIHDQPPIFRTADFFPYRGKEDEKMYQVQTEQARKYRTPFNQSDDLWALQEKGIRPEFT